MKTIKKTVENLHRYLTAEQRSSPDFFIAGTQKGGTTFLYDCLRQHPNVMPAKVKEIHFFEFPENREKGPSWYKSHFPTIKEKQRKQAITGEATPLMYSLHTPRLISEYIPDIKLIFLLRNPIKRAFSHYQHNLRMGGRDQLTFGEAIRQENQRIGKDIEKSRLDEWYDDRDNRKYSYIHRGFYAQQFERWFEYFPKSQIFIEESEYFYKNTQDCLDKITDFLELPRYKFDLAKQYGVGGYSEKISESDFLYLENIFQSENEKLFKLLGKEFWKN